MREGHHAIAQSIEGERVAIFGVEFVTLAGGILDNDGNGTPDVSASGFTAIITDAALQTLINPGADAPEAEPFDADPFRPTQAKA